MNLENWVFQTHELELILMDSEKMRIKGWKKLGDTWLTLPTGRKVKTPEHIIYQSYGPRPANISIKKIYMKNLDVPLYWKVRIWKKDKLKPYLDKPFETKKKALSFAIKWMKSHPEGK